MANKQKLTLATKVTSSILPLFLILSALTISWDMLAKANFFYPQWYQALDIHGHIQEYAPQNLHGKANFVTTDAREHRRLFQQIVLGIHRQTDLATIRYFSPAGRELGILLLADEVTHLEDVAHFVRILRTAGIACLAATALLIVLLWRSRLKLPHPRNVLIGLVAGAASATLLVLILGPVKVFYQMHEWLFPPDNPWFFYYQDSLMTTLMKAPDIFGAIAALWFTVSLLIAAATYTGLWHLLGRR